MLLQRLAEDPPTRDYLLAKADAAGNASIDNFKLERNLYLNLTVRHTPPLPWLARAVEEQWAKQVRAGYKMSEAWLPDTVTDIPARVAM